MRKPMTQATAASNIAFVYVRQSKFKDGISLEMQEAQGRAHAQRLGREVAEVFVDDDHSGRDDVKDRPGLKALIERAQATPGALIIVYSMSRLSRGRTLIWRLIDDREGLGLSVSSATEPFDTSTPMGRAMLGMIAIWNTLEADMVSQRTKDALAELKAQGVKLGNKGMAALDPQIVETVTKLYATGLYSQRELADKLNRDGVPTVTGKGQWRLNTVQSVLSYAKSAE